MENFKENCELPLEDVMQFRMSPVAIEENVKVLAKCRHENSYPVMLPVTL